MPIGRSVDRSLILGPFFLNRLPPGFLPQKKPLKDEGLFCSGSRTRTCDPTVTLVSGFPRRADYLIIHSLVCLDAGRSRRGYCLACSLSSRCTFPSTF